MKISFVKYYKLFSVYHFLLIHLKINSNTSKFLNDNRFNFITSHETNVIMSYEVLSLKYIGSVKMGKFLKTYAEISVP